MPANHHRVGYALPAGRTGGRMSIWNCETHGRTGPIACCGGAVRESSTDAAPLATIAVTHPPQDAEAVRTAEAVAREEDALGEVIGASKRLEHIRHPLTQDHKPEAYHKEFRRALAAYAAAIEARVRGERIGYAVWDAGSPTLMPDADPSEPDGEYIKPTSEAAQETIQWLSKDERATAEVVAVYRLGGS